MKAKKFRVALILVIVVAAIGAGGLWYWRETPSYALYEVVRAIKAHDRARFEEHVDTQAIANNLVEQIAAEILSAEKSQDPAEAKGQQMALSFVQLLKPKLAGLIQEKLFEFVDKGAVQEGGGDALTVLAPLAILTNRINSGSEGFQGVDYIKREKDQATVGLAFKAGATPAVLDLKMTKAGGKWKVVEVSSFAAFLKKIETK